MLRNEGTFVKALGEVFIGREWSGIVKVDQESGCPIEIR
jgi:hypothetical protein